jgi:proteasome lid subunit RPN8/RPN11
VDNLPLTISSLCIDFGLWQKILDHIQQNLPEEACGFIAGKGETAGVVLPIRNHLHSQVRFEMDGKEMIQAILWMEEQELEMLSIFHSHPNGPPVPSATDLSQYRYPEAICLIISPANSEPGWQARGFWMKDLGFEELPVIIGV